MAFTVDIQPILDLISRPIGDSNITVGVAILIFIIFYIISQKGGGKW